MKALGAGLGAFAFRDVEVVRDDTRRAVARTARRGRHARRRARRASLAALADAHRRHRDGGRARARLRSTRWSLSSRPRRWTRPTGARSPPAPRSRCSWTAPGGPWPGRCDGSRTGRTAQRVVLVCGKGNNGGDGLVAGARARGLGHARPACSSWPTGSTTSRSRVRWPTPTWPSTPCSAPGSAGRSTATPRGRRRAAGRVGRPDGRGRHPVGRRRAHAAWSLGPAVRATRTVTFAARKPGVVFEPGRSYSGRGRGRRHRDRPRARGRTPGLVTDDDVRAWLPPRAPDAHKWRSGVMVVGGSGGMTGAPMFVSHAAMRAGAGIVWCGLPGRRRRARRAPAPR